MSDTIDNVVKFNELSTCEIATPCLVCNEPVITSEYEIMAKRTMMCDECRKAILYMRKHIVNPEVLKEN